VAVGAPAATEPDGAAAATEPDGAPAATEPVADGPAATDPTGTQTQTITRRRGGLFSRR
jgi:hypothetical protein